MAIISDIMKDGEYWILINVGLITDSYYESLKYEIPKRIDKKGRHTTPKGSKILVKIRDLKDDSNMRVTKVCDYCDKKVENQTYQNIIRRRKENNGLDLCDECAHKKGGETRRSNTPVFKSIQFKYPLIVSKWDFSLNDITPDKVASSSPLLYWWKCRECESSYEMSADQMTREGGSGSGCPYCRGFRVNETNCLWTTHPHVAKILKDETLGYKVTSGTHVKADFICSNCNTLVNNKYINNVVRRGLSCPICSDGISYPEKFVFNVLSQLNLKFETQITFEWSKNVCHDNVNLCGSKRYDFYIPSLNCIIEVHGGHHYHYSYFEVAGGKTLDEERENDELKMRVALNNGIENYVVIECKRSEFEYIKSKIIQSTLSRTLDLSKIDWLKCHIHSCRSLVRDVCILWSKDSKTLGEIGEIFKISKDTVRKYLKMGAEAKWCDYNTRPIVAKQ